MCRTAIVVNFKMYIYSANEIRFRLRKDFDHLLHLLSIAVIILLRSSQCHFFETIRNHLCVFLLSRKVLSVCRSAFSPCPSSFGTSAASFMRALLRTLTNETLQNDSISKIYLFVRLRRLRFLSRHQSTLPVTVWPKPWTPRKPSYQAQTKL